MNVVSCISQLYCACFKNSVWVLIFAITDLLHPLTLELDSFKTKICRSYCIKFHEYQVPDKQLMWLNYNSTYILMLKQWLVYGHGNVLFHGLTSCYRFLNPWDTSIWLWCRENKHKLFWPFHFIHSVFIIDYLNKASAH